MCHAEGKVWVAITLSSTTPVCGEALASFTCDKATVLNTFYTDIGEESLKEKLTKEIAAYERDGLKLNDCGKVSDSEYRLHWYRKSDDGDDFYEMTDIVD
jgi:hypothetical protein